MTRALLAAEAAMAELSAITEVQERLRSDLAACDSSSEGFMTALRMVWHGGPSPMAALLNFMVLTHIVDPSLLGGASMLELGKLCGETKAAFSKRLRKFHARELKSKMGDLKGRNRSLEARKAFSDSHKK